jgi:hypothetical protein
MKSRYAHGVTTYFVIVTGKYSRTAPITLLNSVPTVRHSETSPINPASLGMGLMILPVPGLHWRRMMRNALEGMCSYLTSATAFFVSINWGGVGSAVLMVGSIILLLMRLYVEYSNFKERWRNNRA